mmetsp:Transcript_124631/g.363956  ORF Transcript_124631/g.363956 Transcript_124631/m.363956 type:complete len:227 (-) Transcript_124631:8-688(-)
MDLLQGLHHLLPDLLQLLGVLEDAVANLAYAVLVLLLQPRDLIPDPLDVPALLPHLALQLLQPMVQLHGPQAQLRDVLRGLALESPLLCVAGAELVRQELAELGLLDHLHAQLLGHVDHLLVLRDLLVHRVEARAQVGHLVQRGPHDAQERGAEPRLHVRHEDLELLGRRDLGGAREAVEVHAADGGDHGGACCGSRAKSEVQPRCSGLQGIDHHVAKITIPLVES